MAENEATPNPNPNPNPFSSIISKFTQLFNFQFPPPPPSPAKKDVSKSETESKTGGFAGGEVTEVTKTVTVSFPAESVAPVKLESEELQQSSSPGVAWQVYAIGGFFILKWMVGRWKEQRANKKSPDEDLPPPPPVEADE